jgi:hypothetical protein
VPAAYLGATFALDVLIHERIHVNVEYCLGGSTGPTSHNCPEWIGEVNRIASLIGLHEVQAGRSVTRRVATESGGPKKVKRVDEGNVPFDYVAGFPYALRRHRDELDYYMHAPLPFESVMADATIGSVV